MFYFVVIMAALAWLLLGAVGAYALSRRQRLSELTVWFNQISRENVGLRADLECVDDALVHQTALATRMMDERDNALQCLEMVIDNASTKELVK